MSAMRDVNHPKTRIDAEDANGVNRSQTFSLSKSRSLSGNNLPERYTIKTTAEERVLVCLEAPNVKVHIEAGLTVSGSIARKSPAGTIFLDGVAQCEPFLDHERQIYNFDHHEGCVRSFTMATCEQTLVMYMKGLDFQSREWNVFANEPDLDVILAIWIILNHARIGRQDTTQRRILFALVHFEGLIDALGLELKELSALPPDLMRKIQRVIDHLRLDEVNLKKEGQWGKTDYLAYTAAILHKIDQIFYKADDFKDYQGIQELARIDLSDQRICAVVEADMGIYEIEPHLNKLYGSRLGIVFLKKGKYTYTVRQMDPFMSVNLESIYNRLNFADPAVKCRTQTNKWGGSGEIGGSPRDSGTRLDPIDILHACRLAVRKPNLLRYSYHFVLTSLLLGAIVLCAAIARHFWESIILHLLVLSGGFWEGRDFGFMTVLLVTCLLALIIVAYRHPWQYGFTMPIGRIWWLFLPLILAAGLIGGLWTPPHLIQSTDRSQWIIIGAIGMPLAIELLFRGLGHGLLAQTAAIQRYDTHWFVSWPVLGSTLLYLIFILAYTAVDSSFDSWLPLLTTAAGAACFGLSLGMVRERSQSLLPVIFFHILSAAAAFLIGRVI